MANNVALFVCVFGTAAGYSHLDGGLHGSEQTALHAAELLRYHAGDSAFVDVALVTLVDADPVNGTPLNTGIGAAPAGFAVGAVNITDPGARVLAGTVYPTLEGALEFALAGRTATAAGDRGSVYDVVALTITATDPARTGTTLKEPAAP